MSFSTRISLLLLISFLSLIACNGEKPTDKNQDVISPKKLIPEVEQSQSTIKEVEVPLVNMLVEIPSGTVEKYEFDKQSEELRIDSLDGRPRLIKYLGYPGNYGMIPNTLLPEEIGGDGDPLDIIAIGPPVDRGSILTCKVIGVLRLLDGGEKDDKLIALSTSSTLDIESVNSLEDLNKSYPGISTILKLWFTNYKGKGLMTFEGFGEKDEALEMLQTAKLHHLQLKN